MPESKQNELREELAAIEHERWSDWQKYMHSMILPSADDGIMQIGEKFVKRWERQINTPYHDLSESEKQSDREQVDRYWSIVEKFILREKETDREEIRKLKIEPNAAGRYDTKYFIDTPEQIEAWNYTIDQVLEALINKK